MRKVSQLRARRISAEQLRRTPMSSTMSTHVELQTWYERGILRFLELSFTLGICNYSLCLSITRRNLYCTPPAGLISRVRIVVKEDGKYEFQVVMRIKESGSLKTEEELFELCSTIDPAGGYKFCPSINASIYETKYLSIIRYDIKAVRRISDPIVRVDSKKCILA